MWDQFKICFGETSKTRLLILQLKWMQYKMDSNQTIAEYLQIMGGIIRDLMAIGKEIYKGEQVLNVIRALPDKPEHWIHVKMVLTHVAHLKTFAEIQSHLQIEEERMKMFSPPSVALVAKGNRPKGNKSSRGIQAIKGSCPPQKDRPKAGIVKKQKAKGKGEKKI